MANPVKGEVPLKLADGREFTLVMDMEALVEAEQAYGKPLAELMADAARGFVGASRSLLFGGLQAKHPGLPLKECTKMLMSDGDEVGNAISAAVEASFPDAQGEGEQGSRPLGKTSGANGAKSD